MESYSTATDWPLISGLTRNEDGTANIHVTSFSSSCDWKGLRKPELSNLTAISFLRSSKCTSLSSLSLKLIKRHGMKHHVTWSSISISFHSSRLLNGYSWIGPAEARTKWTHLYPGQVQRDPESQINCVGIHGIHGQGFCVLSPRSDWIQSLFETTFPQNPI